MWTKITKIKYFLGWRGGISQNQYLFTSMNICHVHEKLFWREMITTPISGGLFKDMSNL